MSTTLILINPWIYDFAAYDLWSKPLGLLCLASDLRKNGFSIHLIDCLDIRHPGMEETLTKCQPVRRAYGTGKFLRERVTKPDPLAHVPRTYSRYGIPREVFLNDLREVQNPSAILVTSLMTYWYPGVREVIRLAKEVHPGVPVILGGIYAGLCEDHARETSGADHVIAQRTTPALDALIALLDRLGIHPDQAAPKEGIHPYPAFDLLHGLDYVCLSTSIGCPFRCRYCASPFLNACFLQRGSQEILDEIIYWHRTYGVLDFAFYDDALLVNAKTRMVPVMEVLAGLGLGLRFHTPNALHVREVSCDVARLLYASGFRTIRLGLETADMDPHNRLDKKVRAGEFEDALQNLHGAGFTKKDIGAYILAGLPGQSVASVLESIHFADRAGAMPYLAEYSPIPHTTLWETALASSEYNLANEPLFHNNTLMACWDTAKREKIQEIKDLVREIRQKGARDD